jgi:RHS repeat-associated protein
VSDGTNTYNLYYDALGRCVKRSLNGITTYYIYDGEKPILEYGPNNALAKNVYGKGIDEILMRTDPGANNGYAIYYAQDHEGSVTHLLDGRNTPSSQTGNVIEQYKYDSFGAPTFLDAGGNQRQPNATAYNNRFLFTGREYAGTYRQQYIPAFTFYEYRARAYDPTLGRFMSEDPKGFDAGDYNFFRYCHNDPIDFTDPMGLAGDAINWQGNGPTDNHSAQAMMADLRQAVQQVLRQIAQQQAYAHAMGYPGHGAIGIGMANFQAGELSHTIGGPTVNWSETGNNNIRQPYVLSDHGDPLIARTYASIRAGGTEDEFGGLKALNVEYRVDAKYATTAGPNSQKFARLHEPDHEQELRAGGVQLRSIAQNVANTYRAVAPLAISEVNRALQAALSNLMQQSHNRHDLRGIGGHDDHVTYRPYDW